MLTIDDLRFTECAYFYRLKNGKSISPTDIQQMFINATAGKAIKHYEVDVRRAPSVPGVTYSIRVFKFRPEKPSFIVRDDDYWKEQKIGYLLFIEYLNYVIILRRNASVSKKISEKLENIDYDKLMALKANAGTSFKKLSIQNLDGSDRAMRYKSFEALNLSDNISPLGVNRYFVRTVKGANGGDNFSLTLYMSRINEFESGLTIGDVCGWAKRKVDEIEGLHGQMQDNLLSSFASPEKYNAIYQNLVPTSLLVFYGHLASLHDDNHAELWRIDSSGRRIEQIGDDLFERYIRRIGKAFTQVNTVVVDKKVHYYVGNGSLIEIRILSSGIKLKCKTWENLIITNTPNGEFDGTLQDYFNDHQQFNVYFANHDVVYSNRMLFRDKRLLSSVQQFMKVLQPLPALNTTLYEKHDRGRGSLVGLNNWHQRSIFHVVEQQFMGGFTHFICDDCNDEWADHIGISEDKVVFFCSKHKESTDSASDFQDVVGQALKNLGNLAPANSQLTAKVASWSGRYQTSNMQRMRSGNGTVQDAVNLWNNNKTSPNFERSMCLVVDFLSKQRFENQLNAMVAAYPNNINSELFQRLWLLSSFINGCLDMGVKPVVYCKA